MKLSNYQLQIYGKSNKKYIFDIFSLDTQFKPVGGIYIFTQRIASQTIPEHKLIYCGKTNDLSKRFDNHHKEDCIKRQVPFMSSCPKQSIGMEPLFC